MGMENYSLSDIKAVTDRDDDFGSGSWFWIVVLFLFMFGNGGGLFGNAQGALTRAEMTEGFNNQSVLNKLDGLSNGICDGFYAMNTTTLNGFNGIQRDLCAGFNGVNSAVTGIGYKIDQCCCETNRNIDALRYEAAKNTCDITSAIHAEGEQTRALITQNTIQELRDQLQAAQLQLGNISQTQTLVNELRPCARPAYITCSPYTAYNATNSACAGCA